MKLRYGEGSIERRGERYRAKWYGTDGRRHTKTFPSHEAAAAHLLEVSTRKRRRRYRDPSSLTVAEAVEDWLERGAARWKPATLTSYAHRLEKHVLPRFGSRRVADLTAAEIQAWVDSLRLSPASVVSVQRTLVTVLSDCVRRGIVDHNVAQSVEVPGQRRQRIVTWTPAEVRRVLSYTSQDRRWHAVYHLALSTGMRPGELRALHWADIDPDAGTVTVRRTAVRIDGVMTVQNLTKTEEVRVIRLTPACLAAVEAWRSASRHELVMCYRYGTVVSDVTWRQWHERMCEAAGVRVIGLHGLRHTFATLLLRSGIDVKVVSAMLGHSSVTFTMDTYMHVDTDMQAGAVTALAGVLGET